MQVSQKKKKKYPEGIVTNIYPSMCPELKILNTESTLSL